MSKNIYLYSEDKKYRCAVELADSCDRFNCPDHSALVLCEERENGTYIIAQAQDHLLETEKDQQIAELKQQLAEKDKELNDWEDGTIICKLGELKNRLAEKDKEIKYFESEWKGCQINLDHYKGECFNLKEQLHTQPKEIVEKIIARMDNIVDTLINLGNGKEDAVSWFLGILQEILKEYEEK